MTACVHCSHTPANRPHGLCWHCYQDPGVRDRFAPRCRVCGLRLRCFPDGGRDPRCAVCRGTKGIKRGVLARMRAVDALVRSGAVGPGPTAAAQGSLEKLATLAVRAARGLPLFDGRDRRPDLG